MEIHYCGPIRQLYSFGMAQGLSDYHFVYVVDDDAAMREALADLLSAARRNVVTFGSATEYMAFPRPDVPACLVLDMDLPDMSGLDLQTQLSDEDHPPIVFLTGYGDIPSTVRALKAGAVDFLTKPCGDVALLAAVDTAVARDRDARLARADTATLRHRWTTLSPREREVFPLI